MTLFGQTIYGIHLGLLLLTAASTVLVFLLARRLLDPYAGTVAGVAFALLTLGRYTLAFNIEHLVVFLVLCGSLVMLTAYTRQSRKIRRLLPGALLYLALLSSLLQFLLSAI